MLLFLEFLSLPKDFSDTSNGDTVFHALLDHSFPCPFIGLSLFILVALHSVGLTGASLPVGEYRRMKALHDLVDQAGDLQLLEDLRLTILLIDDLIEAEGLSLDLARVPIRSVLIHTMNKYENHGSKILLT